MTKVNSDVQNVIQRSVQKKNTKHSDRKETDAAESKKEFASVLQESKKAESKKVWPDEGVRLSKHAIERLKERDIELGGDEFMKIKSAIEKIRGKGGRDSLIVAKDSAYIVDIAKNTIVTAMDVKGMKDNVFTKIDSTVFINE